MNDLIVGDVEEYYRQGTRVSGWQEVRGPEHRVYAECTSAEAAQAVMRLLARDVMPKPPCHTAHWEGTRCDQGGPRRSTGHSCQEAAK